MYFVGFFVFYKDEIDINDYILTTPHVWIALVTFIAETFGTSAERIQTTCAICEVFLIFVIGFELL